MIAFAANSLLCRMALGGGLIDPASFTMIRLASGAMILAPIARWSVASENRGEGSGSWLSGAALFGYAVAFSFAYLWLSTGMGALILFAAVQITMMASALLSGERLTTWQWLGSLLALGGLVYLVLPGISAPDPAGALLMGIAGLCWGIYSIRGKGAMSPIAMTSGNFARSAPLAIAVSALMWRSMQLEPTGVLLALTSGMVTSGLGYVLWYQALRGLTTAQASIVQLLVPVLAAFGGVIVLAEEVSLRLVLASGLILGGVAIAVWRRRPPRNGSIEVPSKGSRA